MPGCAVPVSYVNVLNAHTIFVAVWVVGAEPRVLSVGSLHR